MSFWVAFIYLSLNYFGITQIILLSSLCYTMGLTFELWTTRQL